MDFRKVACFEFNGTVQVSAATIICFGQNL